MTHIPSRSTSFSSFFLKFALTADDWLAITTGPFRPAVGVVRGRGSFTTGTVTDTSLAWATSEEAVTTAWIDSARYKNAKNPFKALNIIQ